MQIDITILYKEYYPKLLYYAGKFLPNDKQRCEDIVEEVFIKFIEAGVGNIQGYNNWLYECVHNGCMNEIKAKKRIVYNDAYIGLDEPEEIACEGIKSEVISKLHAYIYKLPGKCKEIFILHYFEGKSNSEICYITGLSLQTVKNQLHKALDKLRGTFGHTYKPLSVKIRELYASGRSIKDISTIVNVKYSYAWNKIYGK
jgi:RNA polymerase sigma-70 factor (ECF subfamily)